MAPADFVRVVSIHDTACVPSRCLETLGHVFGKIQIGGSGERNVILIVEINEFAQLQVSGQRRSFVGDALHKIAIAADGVRVVIDDLVSGPVITRCEPRLGDRDAYSVGETLPERSRGDFHVGRLAALRVTGILLPNFRKCLISSSGRS